MNADGTKLCSCCKNKALYHVGDLGYCKAHMDVAVEAQRKAKAISQSRHSLKQWNHVSESGAMRRGI